MQSTTRYEIRADLSIPPHAPLVGWRKVLARWGLPVRREVMYGIHSDGVGVICHPTVVDKVAEHLSAMGLSFVVVSKPRLVQ